MRCIRLIAGLGVALAITTACHDSSELFVPFAKQASTVAPVCYGRPATIYEGNPGTGTITINAAGGMNITGTSVNDVIVGSEFTDSIESLGGTDRVCTAGGDDVINGGAGRDFLDGEGGTDEVTYATSSAAVIVDLAKGAGLGGDAESDRLANLENVTGSDHDDDLRGNSGPNRLAGGDGNDRMTGGNDADVLLGNGGNDRLSGDAGGDTLDGGSGNDELSPGAGTDQVFGGADIDRVSYLTSPAGVIVDLITGFGANGDAEDDAYDSVESILGSEHPDKLNGDGNVNVIHGYTGVDTIRGGAAADTLRGNLGNDVLYGEGGADVLMGDAGDDELYGDAGNDRLFGGADNDDIYGGDDDDDLRPGSGVNTADGGPGNDHLDSAYCLDSYTNIESFVPSNCVAAASAAHSTISPVNSTIAADGVSATTITVQLKDTSGTNLTIGGSAVSLSTTAGVLTDGVTQATTLDAVDQEDGTYTLTLISSTDLETAVITGVVNGDPVTDDAQVQFVVGALDHFAVTGTDGNPITQQAAGVAFNIKIVAQDAADHTVSSFTGTVSLISTPGGSLGTSGSFTAGERIQSVTIASGNNYTITATRTGFTETGTSNSFTVTSLPNAVANEVAGGSAPNDAYHGVFSSALVISDGAQDLLANDGLGYPAATVTHFGAIQTNNGAGTLGGASGTVTTNLAGATVAVGDGSLTVNADGTLNFTPPTNYTGLFRFQYRIGNSGGTSDAQVTLAVGVRPAAGNDTYSGGTLLGNVTLNTNTGTIYSVSTNDAGDQRSVAINTPVAGSGNYTLNSNGTFTYNPQAGFNGAAGFTYNVTNGFGTVTGSAALTVGTSRIWFVDQSVGVSGTGTQASAFKNPGNITNSGALPNPQDNDVLFVYQNATSYTGTLALRAGQKLVGQDASASLQTISGFTPATHQALPAMDLAAPAATLTSSGTTLTLGSNNTLRGFTLGAATTSALTGSSFGTLTLSGDIAINNPSGMALSLTTGAISGNLASVSSTGGTNNVLLSAVTGTTNFGTGTLGSATGAGLSIVGGTVGLTYAGNISGAAGSRVSVTGGHATGTLVLTGQVSATGGNGLQFDNADGIYNLGGVAASSTLSGGDAGVDVLNGSSGAFTFGSTLSITNPSGTALNIAASSPASVTVNGAISTNASRPVSIVGIPGTCGTITIAGSITTSSNGILVQNCSGGSVTFSNGSKSLSTTTNAAVTLTNNTGTAIDFSNGGLGITTTTGLGFRASGGGTVTVSGANNNISINGAESALWLTSMTVGGADIAFNTITSTGTAIGSPVCLQSLTGSATETVTLTTVNIAATSGGPGICIGGSAPVTISTATVDNTAGAGIEITNSTGAVAVNAGSFGATNDPTGNVVDVDGGNANVTIAANLTKSSAGRIVEVTGHTSGTVSVSGSLDCSNTCTGINVSSNTAGTIEFTNAAQTINTGSSAAVTLSTNTGATINFTGGTLDIDATSGAGFSHTGGGTVNVTGANNTVNTTGGGTAVNITSAIGGSGVSFKRVDATGGGTNGIVLSNTGGAFSVVGDGASDAANTTRGRTTAKSGGGTVVLGSGGTISGKSGDGVSLNTTGAVTLRNMTIQSNSGDGIEATSVSGLTIDNSLVSTHANNSGLFSTTTSNPSLTHSEFTNNATCAGCPGSDIENVRLISNTGTGTVQNSVIANTVAGAERQLHIFNLSGTLNITVTNNRIGGSTIGDGVGVYARENSNVTANFQNDSIHNNSSFGIDSGTETTKSAVLNITVNNTKLVNNFLGITVAHGSSGANTFNLTNNNVQTNVAGSSMGININRLGSSSFSAYGLFSGTISGNVIGTAGVAQSGSDAGDGIRVITNGSGGITRVAILNNTIREVGQHGISASAVDTDIGGGGQPTLEARIQNNSVSNMEAVIALDGINGGLGALSSDNPIMCFNITNNTLTAIRTGIRLRTSGLPAATPTMRFQGWDGVTAIGTYLANNNPAATGGVSATSYSNTGGTTVSQSCTTP